MEELQARISAAEQLVIQRRTDREALRQELEAAGERQRLRRALEEVQVRVKLLEYDIHDVAQDIQHTDNDVIGPHKPHRATEPDPSVTRRVPLSLNNGDIRKGLSKGEQVWSISGMSWLRSALRQAKEPYLQNSNKFVVGGQEFALLYSPSAGRIGFDEDDDSAKGSLAIKSLNGSHGLTFRHSFYIKRGGEYVQWGETGEECFSDDTCDRVYGPDVEGMTMDINEDDPEQWEQEEDVAVGVFGLSHDELVASEWCENDELVIKCVLEVRVAEECLQPAIKVPEMTISNDILTLLENGTGSDVTFVVGGQRLQAHSLILMARSEVLCKQLSSGCREATDKTIVVEDSDPAAFQVINA